MKDNGFAEIRHLLFQRTGHLSTESRIGLLNICSGHCTLPPNIKTDFESDMRRSLEENGRYINIYDTVDLYPARIPKI